ncbi:ABC transporter substrate-binding protein [Hydrogenophaga sp.]|uniref:ABC transporter substrate-binding protein n=1 Tax=Hydrogenophaga sp. TaxID=1904254 RepID=UPI003F6FFA83
MTPHPLRRHALKLFAGALLAAGCLSTALGQTTKLRVSTIPIIDTAPLQVAMAKGFFTAEGLEIDTTPSAGGAAGLPAVAAGQVQIAFSNIISIVLGAKQGLGFEIIAAGSGTGDTAPDMGGLIANKGTAIKTGKDLEGKRLAVNTRNAVGWLYAREWMRATGGNPDSVTFVEVPFPQMSDAVRGNRADAAFVMDPYMSAAVAAENMEVIGWPFNAVQKRVPVAQYAANKTYIQQNPAVIEKFVRAYNKGVDWANANKGSDEWLRIVSGYTRLAPEKVKDLVLPPFEKTVDPAAVETVVGLMRRNGLLDGAFDAKSVLHKTATAR